ncbi:MAG: nodulation protein NfeD [Nitrospinaceae bacterium]|nr:nodulation protein NfeD [Nitrospinaceae bacterium]
MIIIRSLFVVLLPLLVWSTTAFGAGRIIVIEVDGVINPVVAEFMANEIDNANKFSEELIVIQMDTPGGLDPSMRKIIKAIQNSKIPVASFISPGGSRAASAGVFIAIASHISAMEPGTKIGAAHPVKLMVGGEGEQAKIIEDKVVNDTSTYIRSLAEQRGKNAHWAELSVRKNVSVSAEEAKRLNVIDLLAANLDSLVLALDTREVKLGGNIIKLNTAEKNILFKEMNSRQKILNIIAIPNVAYVLMMLGLVGLYLELSNPGLILPGVLGSLSLILALYAMQMLPINYSGLLLIFIGVILLIAEVSLMSYGLLALSGAISIFLGSIMLIDSDDPAMQISKIVLYPTLGMTFLVSIGSIYLAKKTHQLVTTTGMEGLLGEIGVVKEILNLEGLVLIHGEMWKAESDTVILVGEKVSVEVVKGLKIKVRKVGG